MGREPSLRAGLLARIGVGVLALVSVDALACYYTSLHFANVVYDRWLLDSAGSLATALRGTPAGAQLDLHADAEAIVRFDAVDRAYFLIGSAQRGFLAGDPELASAIGQAGASAGIASGTASPRRLDDAILRGKPVRVATILLPVAGDTVTIQVAETLRKRATLAREILLAMVLPQLAILGVAISWSWWSIGRGLWPLTRLAGELQRRGPGSLEPVAEQGLPQEARVLVARLNELLARVADVIQGQRRFLADAAHQIRTPLAAILLHADRALRVDDEATRRESLRILQAAVRRASRVSQQLLVLARAEPGQATHGEFRAVDLAALARRVGAEWVPVAIAQGVDFGLDVPGNPAWVQGDQALIAEVISNLVDNALRYGREHGTVTVIVKLPPGGGCVLAVEDDGPGIAHAEREQVFGRFYRIEGAGGDGCGLGLAIVQEIARQHGARVGIADGSTGHGVRIELNFPAAVPEKGY